MNYIKYGYIIMDNIKECGSNFNLFIPSAHHFFIVAFIITFKQSWTFNLIIWGGLSMFVFSPIISLLTLIIAQYATEDPWAGIIGVYMLPILEII